MAHVHYRFTTRGKPCFMPPSSSSSSPFQSFHTLLTCSQEQQQKSSSFIGQIKVSMYFVQSGEFIKEGQLIAQIMRDNIIYNVISDRSGIVKRLIYNPNDLIPSDENPILELEEEGKEGSIVALSGKLEPLRKKEEKEKENRKMALKLSMKALIIATILDIVLAIIFFFFIREYFDIKTIAEFKEKLKGLFRGESKESQQMDILSEKEKREKMKNLLEKISGEKKTD
jgi:hypothetical protein